MFSVEKWIFFFQNILSLARVMCIVETAKHSSNAFYDNLAIFEVLSGSQLPLELSKDLLPKLASCSGSSLVR